MENIITLAGTRLIVDCATCEPAEVEAALLAGPHWDKVWPLVRGSTGPTLTLSGATWRHVDQLEVLRVSRRVDRFAFAAGMLRAAALCSTWCLTTASRRKHKALQVLEDRHVLRVVKDVASQLGDDTLVLRGGLERESLHLSVAVLPDAAHRLAWLADFLGQVPGSGIIYTLTVAATEEVARFLRSQGVSAVAYSGKSDVRSAALF